MKTKWKSIQLEEEKYCASVHKVFSLDNWKMNLKREHPRNIHVSNDMRVYLFKDAPNKDENMGIYDRFRNNLSGAGWGG